jgi:cysteinyl-tRNA synthetase
MLKLHNTLTRKKQKFVPIKEGHVSIYSCGPTVYDYPHLGNYRAYIASDVLKRYLLYKGFKVKHVMNITDVDDKTIRNSKKEGIALKHLTSRYEKAFFEDIKLLNILPADTFTKATEYIGEMIKLILELMKKGLAYKGSDGSVYYKVSAFKKYGKLAHLGTLKEGASGRVNADEYAKEEARDFALWKAWCADDGDVFWDSPFGKGRPGWHIECSAMSMKNLGEHFDIHTGGIDLIFPHHQNEVAQSEGATGKKFVNYWLHNVCLLVNGEKMSKSLGNFYTLRDVLAKGYSARAVRYLLLSTHYRQRLNFTFDNVTAADSAIKRLDEGVRKLKAASGNGTITKELKEAQESFEKAMDDDLNISEALAAVFGLLKTTNTLSGGQLSAGEASKALDFLQDVNRVLAVMNFEEESLPAELADLIKKREELRKKKMFKESDEIRKKLLELGIQLDDSPNGVTWKRLK